MASGAPALEVVDLFNRLVRTAPAETEAIARAEWRLRALARARPNDTGVEVALVYALMLGGKAKDAVQLAERLWYQRNAMPIEQTETFLFEITHLGMYEKGAELLKEVRADSRSTTDTNLTAIAVNIAWGLGQFDTLYEEIGAAPPAIWGGWADFLNELKALGLANHLLGRQKLLNKNVFTKQCLSQLILTPGAARPLELTHYIYINAPYEERVSLEDNIHTQVDRFFQNFGLSEVHWDCANELVVPVTAAPPWHKDFFVKAA